VDASNPEAALKRHPLVDEVPLAADLLAVAASAGLTPYLAIEAAAVSGPPAVAHRLRAVLAAVEDGTRLCEALEGMGRRDAVLQPLVEVLLASVRLGTPAAPGLRRLAADARTEFRLAGTAWARTVPVRLLFPLVFLVFPAFLLLAVVPILLTALPR
jgi:Flp pilus assembly protein TadB